MNEVVAKNKAIEAWNTWRGRYVTPTPAMFSEINFCNSCSEIIAQKLYTGFHENETFIKGYQMHTNGAFISPWPYFDKPTYCILKEACKNIDFSYIFKLRARWCIMFPSIIEYREDIFKIIKYNDSENYFLNGAILLFNDRLKEYGFPLFEKDDLRGINLGGFDFAGPQYGGINLKNLDIQFSELSCLNLTGANLYSSKFSGSSAWHSSFNYAIMQHTDFSYSNVTQSTFKSSDLFGSKMSYSRFNQCSFDSVCLEGSDICDTKLHNSSFGVDKDAPNDTFKNCKINDIKYNDSTEITLKNYSDISNFDSNIADIIIKSEKNSSSSVFIVHGRDDAAKESVARFLEKNGITPIILHEQPNYGMTLIEKFELNAVNSDYAIVIMTPDDFGYLANSSSKNKQYRARQNVIFELGFFFAHLNRKNVFVLKKGKIEIPSDTPIVYESMDEHGGWKIRLLQALKCAGFAVDANKIV